MERLIYSNTIPCKPRPNSPFLPRITRPDPRPKPTARCTAPFPFWARPGLHRFISFSCAVGDTSLLSAKAVDDCPGESLLFSADSGNGSDPKPHFLNRVAEKFSQQQKVVNLGMTVLLSTLFLTFLHPILVWPARASLAAKPALRSELLSSAWTGFFAGCLHTLSGPDHLAALAPLSIGRTRLESAAVGALWGCGHDAGQVLFGLVFLLLKDRLHIEIIRTWGTRVVALTLLVIGAMGIKEASESAEPIDLGLGQGPGPEPGKKKIGLATFATGIVHGLQPDALMMVLPALALPSRLAGAAFLVMFLAGTVMAMGSYTVFIGSCSQALKDRVPRITEKLTWGSSIVAIALGFALLVSQYFGFSLY
ncbi:high-affinity nickel-transport family protein [Striga asiatica]|uniref:High-affinity nickel-transport family protein n=1 Tax=Striga asiatica TaxID=4170 RepID=A0A5A7PSV4_STRAF|nr:high-affinity nickel-transport family protein [Striga asiatica]